MKLSHALFGLFGMAVAGLSLTSPSRGCIALPRDYQGKVSMSPQPIHLDEQRAFLWSEKGQQHMMLSVKYSGGTDEFAWVIPVESRPKIEVDKGAPFTELRRATEVRQVSRAKVESMSMPAGGAPPPQVKVLERREEGPYDLAVLEASSGGGLYKWLKENDFHLSKDARGVLEHYVQKKFVFVAARIRNGSKENATVAKRLRDGNIAPMHLSYRASKLSYPLKVTSGNPGFSSMEFYVLNPKNSVNSAFRRQDFKLKPEGKEGFAIEGPPGTVNPHGQFPTLRRLIGKGGTLVKYSATLNHTERQDDLVFAKL